MRFEDLFRKVTHERVDCLIDKSGGPLPARVFISLPHIGRVWLNEDGTYKLDIPND